MGGRYRWLDRLPSDAFFRTRTAKSNIRRSDVLLELSSGSRACHNRIVAVGAAAEDAKCEPYLIVS